jgi:hypothetical protein
MAPPRNEDTAIVQHDDTAAVIDPGRKGEAGILTAGDSVGVTAFIAVRRNTLRLLRPSS